MPFYNRWLAQPVQRFVDLFGKVQPLDVVEYGGASCAAASVNNSTAAILSTPPAGFAYRLHRLTTSSAAVATISGNATGHGYGYTAAGVPDNLDGLVVSEAVNLQAVTALTGFLFYDLITTPNIS